MTDCGYGTLEFSSSLLKLDEGFKWARQQALSYVHNGEDAVGLWYEAALPARNAFCMRDTAHHAAGAAALGLAAHTKNMLYQFAKSISEERDWCGYWEITKDGLPCPEDYISDSDFWYNFPGSFEIIIACWQEYLRTGDTDYITDPVFNRFYELTCTRFVEQWDKDGDGLLEHYPEYGRRGLASYNECDTAILTAGDMLACQWAAYGAYGEILLRQGKKEQASIYQDRQKLLKQKYLTEWFDKGKDGFYGAILADGSFYKEYYKEGNFLPVYYGILNKEEALKKAYAQIRKNPPENVEGMSYMPQIFYTCGDEAGGLELLIETGNPQLERREYPEVSFAYVGSVAGCVMGIKTKEGMVITKSGIPEGERARMRKLPIFDGTIDVSHEGKCKTVLKNETNKTLEWKAVFSGNCREALLDEKPISFENETDEAGAPVCIVYAKAEPTQESCIRVVR